MLNECSRGGPPPANMLSAGVDGSLAPWPAGAPVRMRFRITSAGVNGTTRLVTGHAVDALAKARDLAKGSAEVWIADDAGQR